MGGAAGDHEQVPDAVRVGESGVERIEDDADRIEYSAGRDSGETGWAHGLQQREQGHQGHPAHHDVDHH